MTEQYNKKADEIAALYGLSLTGRGFEMADDAEWQEVREQVMVRIPHEPVVKWLDEAVKPRVKFVGGVR